jgi:hypothetical protein
MRDSSQTKATCKMNQAAVNNVSPKNKLRTFAREDLAAGATADSFCDAPHVSGNHFSILLPLADRIPLARSNVYLDQSS